MVLRLSVLFMTLLSLDGTSCPGGTYTFRKWVGSGTGRERGMMREAVTFFTANALTCCSLLLQLNLVDDEVGFRPRAPHHD